LAPRQNHSAHDVAAGCRRALADTITVWQSRAPVAARRLTMMSAGFTAGVAAGKKWIVPNPSPSARSQPSSAARRTRYAL
jgi:hypothetical protein